MDKANTKLQVVNKSKEAIIKLYQTGLTQMELASAFGVSQQWISQVVRQAGIPTKLGRRPGKKTS